MSVANRRSPREYIGLDNFPRNCQVVHYLLFQEPTILRNEEILKPLLRQQLLAAYFMKDDGTGTSAFLNGISPNHISFKNAYEEVRRGLPTYKHILAASQLDVRMQTARVLKHVATFTPVLQEYLIAHYSALHLLHNIHIHLDHMYFNM